MKRLFILLLAPLFFGFGGQLFSQSSFPVLIIDVYGETEHLKENDPKLDIKTDSLFLEHNYMFVITFPDSTGNIGKIHIKVGSSSGAGNFFQGAFAFKDIVNVPEKCYYGVNGNKHYIKVYLENINKDSAKNYSIQLENKQASFSSVSSGLIIK